MTLKNIKDIDLGYNGYEDDIFITFDLDWCSDEILSYTLDIIEAYNIKVTFFITHKTKLLKRMRANKDIELGIHPNFNPLLNGDFRYGKNIEEVVKFYMKIVPEAVSVRSHSMTQNSQILDVFEQNGLKYDCNTYIPFSSNISLKVYSHWTDYLIKVPYFWEDDVHCYYNWEWNIQPFLVRKGLKVFNFHPIHIFLNTEKIERYSMVKKLLNDYRILEKNIHNKNFGSKCFFISLLENTNTLINK